MPTCIRKYVKDVDIVLEFNDGLYLTTKPSNTNKTSITQSLWYNTCLPVLFEMFYFLKNLM